jgi:UDP-N-acetylglucosamine 2-epimerase (non-hydrolysing)
MYKLSIVVGIRPDFIRTAPLIKRLKARPDVDLSIIWTGQHYDEDLMGVFFRQLGIPKPTHSLTATGSTHCEQHSKLIAQLEVALVEIKPDACIFLGDANAVVGAIVPLKLGIPIVHIEAGMRSFDWSMPEERNRVMIDSISNVLYVYHQKYANNLKMEGVSRRRVKVVGNTIVEVMNDYAAEIDLAALPTMRKLGVSPYNYAVMTLHRDGAMNNEQFVVDTLNKIGQWVWGRDISCVLPVMPRLAKIIEKRRDDIFLHPYILTQPLGLFEYMGLEKYALIEFTDSGTNQETSSLCGTPAVILRKATERPETFMSGISVMETEDIAGAANSVVDAEKVKGFSLGPTNTSQIIVDDLMDRLQNGRFQYEDYSRADNKRTFSCAT